MKLVKLTFSLLSLFAVLSFGLLPGSSAQSTDIPCDCMVYENGTGKHGALQEPNYLTCKVVRCYVRIKVGTEFDPDEEGGDY